MAQTISLKSLHLEYRLWIAELNYDITLIRIFNDRLVEIIAAEKDKASKVAQRLSKKLNEIRESIDGLSHRLQIEKMNLAATARENPAYDHQIDIPANHSSIRNDFYNFRISFNELKSDFLSYQSVG